MVSKFISCDDCHSTINLAFLHLVMKKPACSNKVGFSCRLHMLRVVLTDRSNNAAHAKSCAFFFPFLVSRRIKLDRAAVYQLHGCGQDCMEGGGTVAAHYERSLCNTFHQTTGTLAEWLTRCPAKAIPSGACVRITQVSRSFLPLSTTSSSSIRCLFECIMVVGSLRE